MRKKDGGQYSPHPSLQPIFDTPSNFGTPKLPTSHTTVRTVRYSAFH